MRRIIEPKIVSINTIIAVPIRKAVMIIQGADIDWEDYFIRRRESAKNEAARNEFDNCRAVVKWAKHCNGKINYCKCVNDDFGKPMIEFEIAFSDRDGFIRFEQDFEICVNGSVM